MLIEWYFNSLFLISMELCLNLIFFLKFLFGVCVHHVRMCMYVWLRTHACACVYVCVAEDTFMPEFGSGG